MRADQETKEAVNKILEKMAQAIAAKDITAFMRLFAKDSNMLTVGLEEAEMSIGANQLQTRMQETFKEAETISLKYGWTTVKGNGPVAWVASHPTYNIKKKGQEALSLSTRLTGILEKIDGNWLWVQMHFSMARNIHEAIADAFKKIEEDKAKAAEAAQAAAAEGEEAAPPADEAGKKEEPVEEEAPAQEEETIGFYELP
jgi:uncharacterized protein (TIGR02246 family)